MVLTSTQNLCLSRNQKNNVYPCKSPFYYIKVGFKGIKIIKVCFRDSYKGYTGIYHNILRPAVCRKRPELLAAAGPVTFIIMLRHTSFGERVVGDVTT